MDLHRPASDTENITGSSGAHKAYKDSSLMAGLEIFSGQDHCPSRAGPVFTSPGRGLGPRPRRRHSHLTMADHVTVVCRAAYFHLRQLRLITRSLSVDAAMMLVQSFATSSQRSVL